MKYLLQALEEHKRKGKTNPNGNLTLNQVIDIVGRAEELQMENKSIITT